MIKNKQKSNQYNGSRVVEPVEVYCRIRPLPAFLSDLTPLAQTCCLKIIDDFNLVLQIPECSSAYKSGQIKQLVYSFCKIFNEMSKQKDIFEEIALPLVSDLLAGKNGLLFTYGVTGSGKTYSMLGNQQDAGLLQRSLDTLFNSISYQQAKKYTFKPDKLNSFELLNEVEAAIERQQPRQNTKKYAPTTTPSSSGDEVNGKFVNVLDDHIYAVFISCIEIYNNYIYDLLDSTTTTTSNSLNSKESKYLKEDSKGSMYIKDVAEIEVKSTEEALELMYKPQKRRVVAYTDLNAESSRSHSIFTIRVVQVQQDPSELLMNYNNNKSNVHVSQLSLVDLAGSERTKRTKNTGCRLREAGSINSSLMALRNCMEVLKENIINQNSQETRSHKKMVPYRDSKLTLLFKNYFEGFGKIKMVLCINPSAIEFDETINVLKFSDLVKDILVPSSNSDMNFHQSSQLIPGQVKHQANHHNIDKMSMDVFEQANLALLSTLQKNNYSIMPHPFPPMDIYSADDSLTINNVIIYLEEFKTKRDSILLETDLLKSQFYTKLRDLSDQLDKCTQERSNINTRLDQKERDQIKSQAKIKALEKLINGGSVGTAAFSTPQQRTPLGARTTNSQFTTPSTVSSSSNHRNEFVSSRPPMLMNSANNCVNNEMTPLIGTTTTVSSSAVTTTNSISNRRLAINFNQNVAPQAPSTSTLPPLSTPNHQRINVNKFNTPTPMRHIQQLQEKLMLSNQGAHLGGGGVPVANRRAMTQSQARRSKSADRWLDHKGVNTPKLDTVMQPKMEHKKSVSKLELSDARKSSKYLLTHQQQDEDGEIITNLIKGNICPSPSGGANCIFTDIEVLQCKMQSPPKPVRKRPNEEENIIEDKQVVQDRCLIALEGHSSISSSSTPKPVKKVKV